MSQGPRRLDEAELLDWLRLSRSDNVGPRTFAGLIVRFGTATAAIAALPTLSARVGRRPIRLAPLGDIEREAEALRRTGLLLLPSCDPRYPDLLRRIDSPPPLLVVKGRAEVMARPTVAIVGSRNASAVGLLMTERLARGLGEAGYSVVSGLARGIDTRAHQASLATGTVGVLAGGHERLYPSENAGLAARMAETGAVVSEMPLTWEPRGRDFPRRNRIVSGLCVGTVVVEAARRSGSLITARFALEQGRTLFAVPGSPLDPRAEGTNDLLRQGAIVCGSVEHVLEDLQDTLSRSPMQRFNFQETGAAAALWDESDAFDELNPPTSRPTSIPVDLVDADDGEPDHSGADRVLALVGAAPVAVDDLVRLTNLPAGTVQSMLVDLEMAGAVIRTGNGAVAKRPE